jgi:hypothetical protein
LFGLFRSFAPDLRSGHGGGGVSIALRLEAAGSFLQDQLCAWRKNFNAAIGNRSFDRYISIGILEESIMRWRVTLLIIGLLFGNVCALQAQYKLYESTFNGGVVTGGYSNGATIPSGSGNFNVSIPPGSTIRRAYLIAGRCGAAPDVTVTLNGAPFTFSNANIITTGFNTIYGGLSAVHAIDITASISAATSAYTIAVPVQNTVSDKFPEFYLYIAFDNGGLPAINSAIYLNTTNLDVNSYAWTLNTTAAVTNANPVGLGILGGYAAVGSDCEQVNVNGTNVGAFGGQDFNAASQWGTMSGFQYYNGTLTGYNDDNADQAINLTDALSNIQLLIPGSTNAIPVTFTHCTGGSDNHVWALFLSWSGVILDGKMLDFQAEPQEDRVLLRWETSDELGLGSFELQRSHNGQDFETIGSSTAQGDAQAHAYTWPDAQPRLGSNWYRVRAVGTDGVDSFSEIREVNFEGMHSLAAGLSPNPMHRGGTLHVQLLQAIPMDWTLYSLADSRQLLHGHTDGGLQASLPTASLIPGVYGLQLQSGTKLQVLRFVVE